MKRLILISALLLGMALAAQAQVSLNFGLPLPPLPPLPGVSIGVGPYYGAPDYYGPYYGAPPVYYGPNYYGGYGPGYYHGGPEHWHGGEHGHGGWYAHGGHGGHHH